MVDKQGNCYSGEMVAGVASYFVSDYSVYKMGSKVMRGST